MKMSEIDRETVKQYARIDTDADDGLIESVYMPMAKEYILSYTGMTEEEAAEHEDVALAFLILCCYTYDNRGMGEGLDGFIHDIIGKYAKNLL